MLADIPGLIEGAHEGAGLGDRFLGHVERCNALLHLVDATQEDVAGAYKTVRSELEAYGGGLAEKPEIVALSKIDALTPKKIESQLKKLQKVTKKKPLALSSHSKKGVAEALREVFKIAARASTAKKRSEKSAAWRP